MTADDVVRCSLKLILHLNVGHACDLLLLLDLLNLLLQSHLVAISLLLRRGLVGTLSRADWILPFQLLCRIGGLRVVVKSLVSVSLTVSSSHVSAAREFVWRSSGNLGL